MRKHLLALGSAALLLTGAAQAQSETTPYQEMPAGEYVLDKSHASLTWKVSHFGLSNYTARFTRFDATVDFDPANPANSTLSVTVDPTSVETDYPNAEAKDFDKELAESDRWFNAGEFPEISFVSTGIEMTGETTGIVTGDLRFMGVTKPASLDVTFNAAFAERPFSGLATLGFSATGTVTRSDWGMSGLVPNIGDDVDLLIEVEFYQPKD
ncbi:MAG: YceI family protein [Aquisalinus sp.]|nr:YceI family protein [Aquisalinus sp.]